MNNLAAALQVFSVSRALATAGWGLKGRSHHILLISKLIIMLISCTTWLLLLQPSNISSFPVLARGLSMMSTRSTRAERVTYADVSAFQAAKEAYDSGEGHASEPAEVSAAISVHALILLRQTHSTSGLWHTKRCLSNLRVCLLCFEERSCCRCMESKRSATPLAASGRDELCQGLMTGVQALPIL